MKSQIRMKIPEALVMQALEIYLNGVVFKSSVIVDHLEVEQHKSYATQNQENQYFAHVTIETEDKKTEKGKP